jgi:protein-tyrosine phosphatase
VPLLESAGNHTFHVVFVCTGNRARSPLAEVLFRKRSAGADVRAESYGTLDLGSRPAMRDAIAVAAELGGDLEQHRARSLQGVDLGAVDLVIGFEPFHVSSAVVEAGARPGRSFTIREFAALLDDLPVGSLRTGPARARDFVAQADAARVDGRSRLSALSLADPEGESRRVYEETGRAIDELTSMLVSRLFGLGS